MAGGISNPYMQVERLATKLPAEASAATSRLLYQTRTKAPATTAKRAKLAERGPVLLTSDHTAQRPADSCTRPYEGTSDHSAASEARGAWSGTPHQRPHSAATSRLLYQTVRRHQRPQRSERSARSVVRHSSPATAGEARLSYEGRKTGDVQGSGGASAPPSLCIFINDS
jgi:hypothetical protein